MITWVSFTTNLFLKAKLSIKNFIWRSLNYCETQSNKNDLKNGQQIIGFFYTIMQPPHRTLIVKKYIFKHNVTTQENLLPT